MSAIEWTDETWNPVLGCSRVSKGCENCYAEKVAHRGMSQHHRGLTVLGKHGPRWTGELRFLPERLEQPLRWKKPRRVFVNSMSDLFHEGVAFEEISAIFGVMAAAPRHTFQVLTKRPARMLEWFRWAVEQDRDCDGTPGLLNCCGWALTMENRHPIGDRLHTEGCADPRGPWPLPHVWLGVSVEDQATADERIPLLLETPAAVRFVSYEPALGPVDFADYLQSHCPTHDFDSGFCAPGSPCRRPALDWVIVGGESGPGARPFALSWARSTIEQCRETGVACFVKQLGADPAAGWDPPGDLGFIASRRDRKGGDITEWPPDLRVRDFPAVRT